MIEIIDKGFVFCNRVFSFDCEVLDVYVLRGIWFSDFGEIELVFRKKKKKCKCYCRSEEGGRSKGEEEEEEEEEEEII